MTATLQRVRAEFILEQLSEREFQVFTRLAHGLDPADIAADLGVSSSSVSTYRHRVLKKLGLRRTVELVMLAHRIGLRTFPTRTKRL